MGGGKALAALNRNGEEMMLDISLSPIKTPEQHYILTPFNVVDLRLQAEKALRLCTLYTTKHFILPV